MSGEQLRTRSDNNDLEKCRKGGRALSKGLLFVLGVCAAVLLAFRMLSAYFPQKGPHSGPMRHGPEQELARLSEELQLNDDQKAKIKPLLEDEHKQLVALRQDSSLSSDEKRAKFRSIREETFNQIRPILTADQQKKLQEMQQKAKHGRGERSPEGGKAPRPETQNN